MWMGPEVRGLGRGLAVGVNVKVDRGDGVGLAVGVRLLVEARRPNVLRAGESGSEGKVTVGATILMVTPFCNT